MNVLSSLSPKVIGELMLRGQELILCGRVLILLHVAQQEPANGIRIHRGG